MKRSGRQNAVCGVRGFSLIELMSSVGIMMIRAGIAIPTTLNALSGVKIRNEAVDFSGLVQAARMQAVRKNTFYQILANSSSGNDIAYFADLQKNSTWSSGDPVVQWRDITVTAGTGSGAPGEAAFESSFNFTFNTANSGLPAMDARGLPCVVSGATCPETPGSGFIIYFSDTTVFGNTNWTALVITPSGRAQIWTYSGGSSGTWYQG